MFEVVGGQIVNQPRISKHVNQPAGRRVIVAERPIGDFAGVNEVSLCRQEPIHEIANRQAVGARNSRGAARLKIFPLFFVLGERAFGDTPRAELYQISPDFFGPSPCRTSEQREIRNGLLRLLRLALRSGLCSISHRVTSLLNVR